MPGVVIKKIRNNGKGLFANKNFKRNEIIVSFRGTIIPGPTKYSVQIDWGKHLESHPPAKFLNHSCYPNAGVKTNNRGYPFLSAMRNIKKGEEVTFDYAMSEYNITPKFHCRCGSKNCRKLIGGFKFLDTKTKKKYKDFISSYLLKTLLIATNNPGKVLEYKEIFRKLKIPLEIVSLKDLNIKAKIDETGKTFEENAIKKAKFYCKLTNLPTLSDDSGIEIDYLNGEPGVKSRRWPGYEASDEEIIKFTLKKLKGIPQNKRGAQLRAVIGLAFPETKRVYIFEGILRGSIAKKPIDKSIAGYPFRSIFIPERDNKYLGELDIVAHRKQAVEKALPLLKKNFKF
jgi:XTP/dITP diphosphohydrolase